MLNKILKLLTSFYLISSVVSCDEEGPIYQYRIASEQPLIIQQNYVDLGLSVKWGTCNLGASKPEEYGDFFAWGEIATKTSYTWTNYKYRTSGDTYSNIKFSKYNTKTTYGTVDNKTVLDLSDDAAYKMKGKGWRMPTMSEFKELQDNCKWTWTKINGVNGYLIVSEQPEFSSNAIFLPAAGEDGDTSLSTPGSYGQYWSNTLCYSSETSQQPYRSYDLYFSRGTISGGGTAYRYIGKSIRPVYTY